MQKIIMNSQEFKMRNSTKILSSFRVMVIDIILAEHQQEIRPHLKDLINNLIEDLTIYQNNV